VLLWELADRHEVPMNMDEDDRVSVSFNYGLKGGGTFEIDFWNRFCPSRPFGK
jgi:hypothetical protein